MAAETLPADEPEPTPWRSTSRRGPIALLRICALLILLIATGILGFEYYGLLRIFAGSPQPWADRLDFQWGSWGFEWWRSQPALAGMRLIALSAIAILMLLSAWALKNGLRWGAYIGTAAMAIFLVINTIVLARTLWEVIGFLTNTSGRAAGHNEPVWMNVAIFAPITMVLLEVLAIIGLRLLIRMRVDVLR
jgi:hypothetical protein